MFAYDRKLQYPVKIHTPDARMAAAIISQYGGPDGELGASLRYLSQRFTMPHREVAGLLTDIGVEELGHLEMVGALVHQLTRDLSADEVKAGGFDAYYTDHTLSVFPQAASGTPFTTAAIGVKGDPITDLHEDMAAEQKARTTYENLLRLADDPDVKDVLRFLRQREIVHYQRFAEALEMVKARLDSRNYYTCNLALPRDCACRVPCNGQTAQTTTETRCGCEQPTRCCNGQAAQTATETRCGCEQPTRCCNSQTAQTTTETRCGCEQPTRCCNGQTAQNLGGASRCCERETIVVRAAEPTISRDCCRNAQSTLGVLID